MATSQEVYKPWSDRRAGPCAITDCGLPFKARLALAVLAGQAALLAPAYAGPSGGQVVGGSGVINYGDKLTQIHQHSSRLAIDWRSFNIDTDEKVQFYQPDTSSIALNRILSQDASTIRGSIVANGHVLLVNTRGVLFTETATVNAGGIVVSGLDLNPDDFLNGNYDFSAVDGDAGFVVNRGLITAASGIGLLGNSVANEAGGSLISAGLVSLNAGSEAVLTFDADNMIGIRVTREVLSNELGVDDALLNAGTIQASNVLLQASVSSDLFSNAVNNTGVVQATGIDTSGGVIRLTGLGGDVASSGELNASASGAGDGGEIKVEGDRTLISGAVTADADAGVGGNIQLLGDAVGLIDDAFVSASGAFGGGEVLVGGDYLGGNADVRNAEVTFFGADARVQARATENGDGGRVIVWADDTTRFYGDINADAGYLGGDGGFIETSGKRYVDLNGSVSAIAPRGAAGLWLIDPANITIDDIGPGAGEVVPGDPNFVPASGQAIGKILASDIEASLNNGTDVTITTTNTDTGGGSDGNIEIDADITQDNTSTGSAVLTLNADNNITLNSGRKIESTSTTHNLGLIFDARGNITIDGTITTNGGNIDFYADGSVNVNAAIDTRHTSVDGTFHSSSQSFTNSAVIDTGNAAITVDIGVLGVSGGNVDGSATVGAGLNSNTTVAINGGIFNDAITLSVLSANMTVSGGAAGADTLTGPSADTAWTIDGNNSGSLGATNTAFNGIETLQGGSMDDTFALTATGSIDEIRGGANGVNGDVLVGPDVATTTHWTVDGAGSGRFIFDAIGFSGIETLRGGSGADTFTVSADIATIEGGGGADEILVSAGTVTTASGGAGDDLFTISGSGAITTVSGGAGTDTLSSTAAAWSVASLDGDGADGAAGGTGYSDMEVLTGTGTTPMLTGPALAVTWTLAGSNTLAATGGGSKTIGFSGFSEIQGGAMVDTFILESGGSIANIDGGLGDDIFDLRDATSVTGTLTGGGDSDTLINNNAGLTLGGVGAVNVGTLVVSGIESVEATGSLTGSTAAEDFNLNGTDVTVDIGGVGSGINFSGVSAIDGGLDAGGGVGADSLNNNNAGLVLTGDTTFSVGTVSVSGIETVSLTGAIVGRDISETFTVTATETVQVSGITYGGTTSVDGGSNADNSDVDRVTKADSLLEDVRLTGVEEAFALAGISFTDIESAAVSSSDTIFGSAGDDRFVLTASNTIRANGIEFGGTMLLDGGGQVNGDSLDVGGAGVLLQLDNSFDVGTLEVFDIERVTNTGAVTGSAGSEAFSLLGSTLTVDTLSGVSFEDVDSLSGDTDGTGLADTVDIFAAGIQVTGSGFTVGNAADGILVSNIATVLNTGALLGTSGNDDIDLTGVGTVLIGGISYRDTDSVDGGDGIDTIDKVFAGPVTADQANTLITGDDSFITGGISFSDIETVTATGTLTGSAGDDSFVLTAGRTIGFNSITFNGVDILDGGGESVAGDSLDNNNGNLSLVAGGFTSGGIAVSDIETVNRTGVITGSAGDEAFDLVAVGTVDVAGSRFAGTTAVNAGAAGGDSVNNILGSDIQVSGARAFSAGSIDFTEIEQVNNTGTLVGTAADENFVLLAAGALDFNDMAFSGVNLIDGAAGSDSITAGGSWLLSDIDAVEGADGTVGGVAFLRMESLIGDGDTATVLAGADLDSAWTLNAAGAGEVSRADTANAGIGVAITFSGMNQLQGGAGVDSFVLAAGSIDSVRGGAGADTFQLAGAVVGSLDGEAGTDNLIGTPQGSNWVVDAVNGNRVDNTAFANVEQLQGGAGNDRFELISGDAVSVARGGGGDDRFIMAGADISISGETGRDTVVGPDIDTDWALTTDGGGTVGGNSFSSMEVLQGGSGADTFALDAGSIADVRGGGGGDSFRLGAASVSGVIDGEAGADTLAGTDTDSLWVVESAGGGTVETFTFAGMEVLRGGSGVDTFQLNGGSITDIFGGLGDDRFVLGATVIGGTLDGGAGSDALSGPGAWVLTALSDAGDASGSVNSYRFAAMESLSGDGSAGAVLTGADQDLIWRVSAANEGTLSTAAAGAMGLSFDGMLAFAGGAGRDTLIASGESRPWTVSSGGSSLGGNAISGFEQLEDLSGAVDITTDFSVQGRAGGQLQLGGVGLTYAGSPLTIRGASGVSGEVVTPSLTLLDITDSVSLSGDVDVIAINLAAGGSIAYSDTDEVLINSLITRGGDISVTAPGDISVNVISTSGLGGAVSLISAEGDLIALSPLQPTPSGLGGGVNIDADEVLLSAIFGAVGTPVAPFSISASERVDIRGLTFVNPTFVPSEPQFFEATGTRLTSVTEALASSAVRSAVQNNVEDIEVVDPAIFTALTPYSVEEGALTLPQDQRQDEDEFGF